MFFRYTPAMKRPDLEKFFMKRKVPIYVLLLTCYLTIFLGAASTTFVGASMFYKYHGGTKLGAFGEAINTFSDFSYRVLRTVFIGPPQVKKDRFPDLDGFKKSGMVQAGALEEKGYLLFTSYENGNGQATVQLIRIADQQILHEWKPDLDVLQSMTDKEIIPSSYRLQHPLLLDDGSIVSGVAKIRIDASSKIKWYKEDLLAHHSTEEDADGNLWICSYMVPSSYANTTKQTDHAIAKLSPDGEVLWKKSVCRILEENGYRNLMMAGFTLDPIHLNDIQPALADSKFWKKGDLLLSMRNRSTIALYRPRTNKIVWLKTGPWMYQHDVDFISDHEISIFGNDLIDPNENLLLNGHNNIYVYDFHNDTVSTPYENAMKSAEVRTVTEGLCEILPNGDVFIEETNDCRLLRLTRETAKWEFVRRFKKGLLSMPSWSRYFTEEQVRDILPILAQSKSD